MNLNILMRHRALSTISILCVLMSSLGSTVNAQNRVVGRALRVAPAEENIDIAAFQPLFQGSRISLGTPAESPLGQELLNTFDSADAANITGSTPRTYMGDCFTNNSLPAGTTAFRVTGVTMFVVATTATAYTNIVGRLQLWNTCTPANSPVFTNPAGALQTFNLGPLTTVANTIYSFDITFPAPITLVGGNGTNWGFVQNFQGDTGAGPADTTNLTSLITSSTTGEYAAGTVTTGASPGFGYYRNASGRTDFNFDAADARSLAGLNAQGIGIIINGVSNAVTAANVSVAGHVVSPDGRGITNAVVTITDQSGASRSAITGRSGAFQFDDVESGSTYVVSVASRRFSFTPQTLQLNDNVSDMIFTANSLRAIRD